MKARLAGAALLLAIAGSAIVSGYTFLGPRWAVQEVQYYVNPVNSHMSEAEFLSAVQLGASVWGSQPNASVRPYYMGRTSNTSLSMNGKNDVMFREGSNGGLYGETYWWYDGSNRLIETDIVFYSTYRFFPGESGCVNGLYLADAAAHEFGHVMGLGHSGVGSATMYPTLGWCSTANRMLDPDDLSGIEALYPATGANTPPVVSISTPLTGSRVMQGSAVTLSGSASDREDANLNGSITWRSQLDGALGTGATLQRVLSVGTHTITATVRDSGGATAQAQTAVVVEPAPPIDVSGITLAGRAYKVKGEQRVDLDWRGTGGGSVDIYRDGKRVAVVTDLGAYTDPINKKGGGSYTYKLCNASTSTCSGTVTIGF